MILITVKSMQDKNIASTYFTSTTLSWLMDSIKLTLLLYRLFFHWLPSLL